MADSIVGLEKIETERRKLRQTSAILACAAWAANHDLEADYADMMDALRWLVEAECQKFYANNLDANSRWQKHAI
ncbi:MAG TPA: hypothetical protein VFB63_26025 [Bryobacteraceae bacterium]|nr:hypothetical protein [Bryobacteraceae bacterium]